MKTRIWVRAFRRDDGSWLTTVKVQEHIRDGRLPRYRTGLFYEIAGHASKADALRIGRSDARRLKRFIAKEGRIPGARL